MCSYSRGAISKTLAIVIVAIIVVAAGVVWAVANYMQQKPTTQPTIFITFAGWSAGETEKKNYEKMISDFEAQNPNIKVRYEVITQFFHENILASFAAGAAPDIFYVDSAWAQIFISQGVLYPIGDKLPSDFINKFYPFLIEPFKGPDGKIYGLPKDWSILSLFYNKKYFAQAGIPEPTNAWSWSDLFNNAKIIYQKTGKPGLVIQADFTRWVLWLLSYGAPAPVFNSASDASYFDNPTVKQALQDLINYINQGRREGYVVLPQDVGATWNGEAFGKELAVMTIEGSWALPYLADQFPNLKYGQDYDITYVPKGPSGRATMAYTVALGVNAKSQNIDAAIKFIQFLEGEEGQRTLVVKMGHTLPSISTLVNDPNLWPSHAKELSMVSNYDKVQVFNYGPKTGALESKFSPVLLSAIRGEINFADAINALKDAVVKTFS